MERICFSPLSQHCLNIMRTYIFSMCFNSLPSLWGFFFDDQMLPVVVPLGQLVGSSIFKYVLAFWYKVFQDHLVFFLFQTWNQPFLLGVLVTFTRE